MNGKNIISAIELIANEKEVNKNLIFKALEDALEISIKKDIGKFNLEVNINKINGDIEVYKNQIVVPDIEYEDLSQIKLSEVSDLKIGDNFRTKIEVKDFSRIGAQVFKQLIKKNFKKAENQTTAEYYNRYIGELYNATVKKIVKDSAILTLNDGTEGYILLTDTNGMFLKVGEKVRVVLDSIEENGTLLRFSRNSELYVMALLKREIPAIIEEQISVIKVARVKGRRIKVVVKSLMPHLDAIRECVGIKGIRVKEIVSSLNGEQVDFINYDNDIGKYINNIMSPLRVNKVIIDEGTNKIYFSLDNEDFTRYLKSINVYSNIASQILGKEVIIKSEEHFEEDIRYNNNKKINHLVDRINVDDDLATILVEEGFDTVESILYSKNEDLLDIEGFNIELVNELKDVALKVVALYEKNKLFKVKNINIMMIDQLNEKEILSVEDLADLSTYELLDILDIEESLASSIIISARNN